MVVCMDPLGTLREQKLRLPREAFQESTSEVSRDFRPRISGNYMIPSVIR